MIDRVGVDEGPVAKPEDERTDEVTTTYDTSEAELDNSDEVRNREPLGLSRVGTLTEMVGKDAAAPTLQRIEEGERRQAEGVRSLGLGAWSR